VVSQEPQRRCANSSQRDSFWLAKLPCSSRSGATRIGCPTQVNFREHCIPWTWSKRGFMRQFHGRERKSRRGLRTPEGSASICSHLHIPHMHLLRVLQCVQRASLAKRGAWALSVRQGLPPVCRDPQTLRPSDHTSSASHSPPSPHPILIHTNPPAISLSLFLLLTHPSSAFLSL
jgi:hypothetical protein